MTDPEPSEIDPERLRRDVEAIKEAMGLEERYEGVSTVWLIFGVLTAVAAALSQVVHAQRLTPAYHSVIWLAVLGVGGYASARAVLGSVPTTTSERKPDPFLQFVAIYLASVPVQLVVDPFLAADTYAVNVSVRLGIVFVAIGLGYVVMANSLKAYGIRRADRLALTLGGCWILGLGALLPHLAFLREWGFATFGGVYLAYALASYRVLSRGGAASGSGGDRA